MPVTCGSPHLKGIPRTRDAIASLPVDSTDVIGTRDPRRVYLAASVVCYVAVFALFRFYERPGLGIGHGYYLAILLAATATGPIGGAAAGVVATALYATGLYWNPAVPTAEIPTLATVIRFVAFVLVGLLAGYYAKRSRALLAQADSLAAELRLLARRDFITGLPNQRALEIAMNRRLEEDLPFALILCEMPLPSSDVHRTNELLDFGDQLTRCVGPASDVARLSQDQFAVLAPVTSVAASALATSIERSLNPQWPVHTGWATYPIDARDGLGLYGAACDRLYARKIARGEGFHAPAASLR